MSMDYGYFNVDPTNQPTQQASQSAGWASQIYCARNESHKNQRKRIAIIGSAIKS